MSWIEEINYEHADDELKWIYRNAKNPDGSLDNVLTVHSLRKHTMVGHLSLYKSVLHHPKNVLPKWYLELLGVYVSHLNRCVYCFEHHSRGMKRLLNDANRSQEILEGIKNDSLEKCLEGKFLEGLLYAKKLTLTIHSMEESDIKNLRDAGFSDGEILEINQVVSYFNYANRTVLGLGVQLEG